MSDCLSVIPVMILGCGGGNHILFIALPNIDTIRLQWFLPDDTFS